MKQPVALITNATEFAGPPAVRALTECGFRVLAHDRGFANESSRVQFTKEHPGTEVLCAQDPEELINEVSRDWARLDMILSNDSYPAVVSRLENADPAELSRTLDILVGFPYRLVRAALPMLKQSDSRRIVFITSNRTRLPVPGAAIPDAARAATNALVKSFSVELAAHGIPVNSVAPNFLYSETYYPRAVFVDSEAGRDFISTHVPIGRLAEPSEIGEIIRFLATVRTTFLTGAIIDFSGGWPSGASLRSTL